MAFEGRNPHTTHPNSPTGAKNSTAHTVHDTAGGHCSLLTHGIAAFGLSPGELQATSYRYHLPSVEIENLLEGPVPVVLHHDRGFHPVTNFLENKVIPPSKPQNEAKLHPHIRK